MAGPPSPGPWGVKGGDDVSTTPRTRQRQRRTKDQTKPAPLAVLYFVCFSFVILPATPLATRNPNNRRLSFLSQELSQVVHEHRPVLRPARQLRGLGGVERHAPHRLRVPVFVYVCVWFISMSAARSDRIGWGFGLVVCMEWVDIRSWRTQRTGRWCARSPSWPGPTASRAGPPRCRFMRGVKKR